MNRCMSVQIAVASAIVKQDGFGALYRGLSAGLLRQATYTTARLGIFQGLSDYLKERNDGKVPRLSLLTPAPLHAEHTPLFCPPLRALCQQRRNTAPNTACMVPCWCRCMGCSTIGSTPLHSRPLPAFVKTGTSVLCACAHDVADSALQGLISGEPGSLGLCPAAASPQQSSTDHMWQHVLRTCHTARASVSLCSCAGAPAVAEGRRPG